MKLVTYGFFFTAAIGLVTGCGEDKGEQARRPAPAVRNPAGGPLPPGGLPPAPPVLRPPVTPPVTPPAARPPVNPMPRADGTVPPPFIGPPAPPLPAPIGPVPPMPPARD